MEEPDFWLVNKWGFFAFGDKMKKDLKVFIRDEFGKVDVSIEQGEPFFSAKDVCRILEIKNPSSSVGISCDPKGIHTMETLTKGGKQTVLFVSEPNLYRLIFKSRKANAVAFQDWIFEEVIPSIRKTGKYKIPKRLQDHSKEKRKGLTSEWQKHGIGNPNEYRKLTLSEYEFLGVEAGLRKKDLTVNQVKKLAILEMMEELKLNNNPEIDGFFECRESLSETVGAIEDASKPRKKELN